MSKNPAWHAYNEATRKLNEEYEATVKPLRQKLGNEIESVETKFKAKISPLTLERDTIIGKLQKDYTEAVIKETKGRNDAITRARKVLDAELSAQKEEKEESKVGA